MKQAEEKVARKRYSSDLSARDWPQLALLLVVRRQGKWPLLEVVNAILYVLKNGCVWRDLPGELPPWGTVYWYFAKWQADGTWQRVKRIRPKFAPCQRVDLSGEHPAYSQILLTQTAS